MIGSVDVGCVYRGSDLRFNIVFVDWGDSMKCPYCGGQGTVNVVNKVTGEIMICCSFCYCILKVLDGGE
jgi:hypothetical protein